MVPDRGGSSATLFVLNFATPNGCLVCPPSRPALDFDGGFECRERVEWGDSLGYAAARILLCLSCLSCLPRLPHRPAGANFYRANSAKIPCKNYLLTY